MKHKGKEIHIKCKSNIITNTVFLILFVVWIIFLTIIGLIAFIVIFIFESLKIIAGNKNEKT